MPLPQRLWRLFIAVTLSLATAFSFTLPASATSSTASDLALSLTSMSPGTLTSGDDLKVTVAVRNTGSGNLSGAKASLQLGTNALDSLTAQTQWTGSSRDLNSSQKAEVDVPDLAPGDTTEVSLTLPSSDIHISFSMTTLPVQVLVTGKDGASETSARLHSTTPWVGSSASFTKMTTQIVVPVTLPADPDLFTTTGAARYKAWEKAIGPGSDIDRLLSSDPSTPVTWLIDPTILDPPTSQDSSLPSTATLAGNNQNNPASGSSSTPSTSSGSASPSSSTDSSASSSTTWGSSSNGSAASGGSSTSAQSPQLTTVDELAQRLRTKLSERPASQQVWFTPYGDPDLSALTSDNRPKNSDVVLKRMLGRQLPSSLTALSQTVVAAPVSPLNSAATERLNSAWRAARGVAPTIITPDATLTGSASASVNTSARRSTSGLLMYGADASLSEALGNTTMSDAEAAAAIRARSLAIYQQQPSATRSVLAMGPRMTMSSTRLTQVTDALQSLDWVQTSALQLTNAAGKGQTSQLQRYAPSDAGIWPQPGTASLSSNATATIGTMLHDLSRYAGIVSNGSDIVPSWSRSLDQAASTRWRSHAAAMSSLLKTSHSTVASIPGHVTVLPSGTINFFTDSGAITVTVRNDLARAIDGAQLHLTPRSYAVRFTSKLAPLSIDAGSRTGVRVSTRAQAAGSVDVVAELSARNGVVLGDGSGHPVHFTINARPTGTWIYWVLGIVAVLIFSYGLARNRKKGTRRRGELARDIQL